MILNINLIKSLVEFRESTGITQKEVAERSGLSQQMVSRMENVDYSPTLESFLKYMLALGGEVKIEEDIFMLYRR